MLKEHFPSQQTSLVDQPQSSTSSGSQVFMSGTTPVSVATRSKYYHTPTKLIVENDDTNTPSTSTPPSSGPLHIERPSNDSIIQPPPKGVLHKSSYNSNT